MTENTLQQRINNLFMGFCISKGFMRNALKAIKNGKSEYIENLITKIENPKETPPKETRTTTKTKIVPKEIECVKCKMAYIAAKSPLTAIRKERTWTKTIQDRKTGKIIKAQTTTKFIKTGEYICKNCA